MKFSRGVQYILISGVCFSIVHASVKALSHIDIYEVVFFRALISLIISYYFLYKKKIPIFGAHKFGLFLRGITGSIALGLYFYTLQKMPLATAVTLQYLSPVFVIFFAYLFLNEKFNPWQIPFIALSFMGVVIVKNFDPNTSFELTLIALAGALFSGLAYTFIRKLSGKVDPHLTVFYFPFVTLPIAIPLMWANWTTPNFYESLQLLNMGVLTYVAQIFLTKAYYAEQPSKVDPYKYIAVIYSVIIGYVFFDEVISVQSFFGIVIIILGVYGSDYFARKPIKQTTI
ncbi:MAG: DMT family transporter [Bacteriovoracaceae bacterium]|nr:DMT family transporter [Bacteriovoracaceae bacterium]